MTKIFWWAVFFTAWLATETAFKSRDWTAARDFENGTTSISQTAAERPAP